MHYSLSNSISTSSTRLSLSKAALSRALRIINLGIYTHHISTIFSNGDSVCPFPFSLAANRGIIVYFLFLEVLRCFNSLRRFSFLNVLRSRIRKSQNQFSHANPLSLSQLATSFITTQTKLSV